VAGLIVGVTLWLVFGHVGGLVFGLILLGSGGLVVGLTNALAIRLDEGYPSEAENWALAPVPHAATPNASWRADRTLNLLRLSAAGLVIGAGAGLPLGLGGGLPLGLAIGLSLGFAAGILVGLSFGGHRAWLAYLIASTRLAWAGLLPRRLMPFLDDCHRLGLLRAVGPIYQFRHAALQDHLAATYRQTS